MSMPFRQKMLCAAIPCGAHEFRQVTQPDGTIHEIVDDTKLPSSEQFSTKNMLAAKIPLDDPRFAEVSSEFVALANIKTEPKDEED